MQGLALFDPENGRKLQLSGGFIIVLSLCILTPFFVDLMHALALRSSIPGARTWFPVCAGAAIALLIPIGGACAGIPDPNKVGRWSKQHKVTALLLGLGVAIVLARYAKTVDHLQAALRTAKEKARATQLEAARAKAESPESKARAKILAAQAKMLASAAAALETGSKRLTPKVRKDAVAMAQLASSNLSTASAPDQESKEDAPQTLSTMKVLEAVVGPALTEFVLAELIAFVSSIWGAAAFGTLRLKEELIEEARHESLRGVAIPMLSDEAREGLDVINGTWRGLDLGEPAERGRGSSSILWPTLALDDGPRIFIGSPKAIGKTKNSLSINGENHEE